VLFDFSCFLSFSSSAFRRGFPFPAAVYSFIGFLLENDVDLYWSEGEIKNLFQTGAPHVRALLAAFGLANEPILLPSAAFVRSVEQCTAGGFQRIAFCVSNTLQLRAARTQLLQILGTERPIPKLI